MEFGSSIETLSVTPTTSINYDQIFRDMFSEFAFDKMKGDILGHILRIVAKASNAYFEFTQLNPS